MPEKLIRKDLRSRFNPACWSLVVYYLLMNAVAMGFMVAVMAIQMIAGAISGSFDPMGDITREQFAAILWRYAKYKGYNVSVGENTNILSYNDAFEVSEYAIPAMQWACGAGLMRGDGVNLTPVANATRCQSAALLMRFCELDK